MYNPQIAAFRLTPEEAGGNPDYYKSLMNVYEGLTNAQKPHKMMEEILKQQIENKYAPRKNEADIGNTEAQTGLYGAQTNAANLANQYYPEKIRAEIEKARRGPAPTYSNLEKAQQGYGRAVEQWGADSDQAKQAKTYAQRLAEGLKAGQNPGGSNLNKDVQSIHQKIITLTPKANAAIQKIIDLPSPIEIPGTGMFYADQKAAHHAAVKAAAETATKAQAWPGTMGSIETAIEILERRPYETDAGYRKRLQALQNEGLNNVEASQLILNPNSGKQTSAKQKSDPLGIR